MDSIKILIAIVNASLSIGLRLVLFFLMRLIFDIKIIGYYAIMISFFMAFTFILELGFGIAHLKFFSEAKNIHEKS